MRLGLTMLKNTIFKYRDVSGWKAAGIRLFIATVVLIGCSSAFAQNKDGQPERISQAELEQVLAPIALYPDTILAHILVAATYPIEVVQAERWTAANTELQGSDAVAAVEDMDWDPSVRALVAFPQILKRLSQDLVWTQRLGDAFLADEEQVLASVQNLRELAEQAGSLDEMDKVTVTREDRTIIIEPRDREVVYVPYYDPRVVYGPWRWSQYEPIYWDYPYYEYGYHGRPYYDSFYAHNRHNSFYWGPRVSLSFGFFFNTFDWRDRHLVRISSRHYRPHRYYDHYGIVGHRYGERWVHNPRRRHGHRNRHITHRDYRSQGNSQQVTQQQRISSTLATQRRNNVQTQSSSAGQVQTNRRGAANRGARISNYPSRDSRLVIPGRASAIEDTQRAPIANANRRVTRTAAPRPNRASMPAPPSARSAVVTAPPKSAPARPVAPPKTQTRSAKPAPAKQATATHPRPKRAQSLPRRERVRPK